MKVIKPTSKRSGFFVLQSGVGIPQGGSPSNTKFGLVEQLVSSVDCKSTALTGIVGSSPT